jgi:hypothetical protein
VRRPKPSRLPVDAPGRTFGARDAMASMLSSRPARSMFEKIAQQGLKRLFIRRQGEDIDGRAVYVDRPPDQK